MQPVLLLTLCGCLILFLALDLFGHKKLRLRRTWLQWCLVVALVAGIAGSGFFAISQWTGSRGQSEANLYMAIQYLLDGRGDLAEQKAELAGDAGGSERLVSLLAQAAQEDYLASYFESKQMLEGSRLPDNQRQSVERVHKISAAMLNIPSEDGELILTAGTGEQSRREQAKSAIAAEAADYAEQLGFSGEKGDKYQELYAMDRILNTKDVSTLSEEDVRAALQNYPGDQDVQRLAIKYYAQSGRYEEALDYAGMLLESARTPENYVIYTDVVAQRARDEGADPEDPEAQQLLSRAEQLEEQAAETMGGEERREELLNEAETLRAQASQVEVRRCINYLLAKKPMLGDPTGMYDLQIAKLYLAADDRDQAREYLYRVINNSGTVSEDSPIKEPLEEVVAAYNQSTADETSPQLRSSVRGLVQAESQEIIPIEENTVNGEFTNYVTSTLKYDRIGIHIGRIDTSAYPTVRAYVNINGTKEKAFGLVDDFSEQDFTLVDTQYGINDFRLVRDESAKEVSIAIVLDCSGSMVGGPLEDAKKAALSCVTHMDEGDQQIAIISYSNDAALVVPKTDSQTALTSGVNGLTANGGTNIPAGITVGVDALSGQGNKAIILLTDGQDGNSGQMQDAVDYANKNHVAIYTVGFGDINAEYLYDIADQTGGKFIQADNTTELADIYRTLQKYIVNNYCFEYQVEKNPERDPRRLTINIPEYQASGIKAYSIGGEAVEEDDLETGVTPMEPGDLSIGSVNPSGVSVADVRKGIQLKITGTGFVDGINISIGNLALTDVQIQDEYTLTGRLTGELKEGQYTVYASLPDGKMAFANNRFFVTRQGTTQSVKLGGLTIEADMIGQVSDDRFVASGNVRVNGFIHGDHQIAITAYRLPENFDISAASVNLGDSGRLSGNGRLYISYAQAQGEGALGQGFASLVMGGKDYEVRNGEYFIEVQGDNSDLDSPEDDFALRIPGIANVKFASCKLTADRLQVGVSSINPKQVWDNLIDGIKGNSYRSAAQAAKDKEKSKKDKEKEQATTLFDRFDGELAFALTADSVDVKAKFKLITDPLDLHFFGLNDISFQIDTIDEAKTHEYWQIACTVGLGDLLRGMESVEGEIHSYYWYPDSLKLAANLDPGIPVWKVVNVTKLGGGVEGFSNLLVTEEALKRTQGEEAEAKDWVLQGIFEADINLFKTLNIPASEEIERWGELGAIKQGELSWNFNDWELAVKADLEVLKQKAADAEVRFGKPGVKIALGLYANLDFVVFNADGEFKGELGTNWSSAYVDLGLRGHMDCVLGDFSWDGECSARLDAEFDGSYLSVLLRHGDQSTRYWYDKDSSVLFLNRFHKEVTM
jgi:Mg-chelatase subunit ChlD